MFDYKKAHYSKKIKLHRLFKVQPTIRYTRSCSENVMSQRTLCGKAHIWPKIGVKFNFIVKIIIFS